MMKDILEVVSFMSVLQFHCCKVWLGFPFKFINDGGILKEITILLRMPLKKHIERLTS